MTTDARSSPKLTSRQLQLLSSLIRIYIRLHEPISSKQLAEESDVSVSSATIRNELSVLEQLGMIRAPHTSAGRIPTEDGYRYFVQHLLIEKELAPPEQERIRAEFQNAARDIQKWLQTAASVLARRTNAAALVTEPRSNSVLFKHAQLIGMHGNLVLLVLVLEGGELSQQMLTLQEEASQERLSSVANMINDICQRKRASEIRSQAMTINDFLAAETMELVSDVMREAEEGGRFAIHWYGFGDLLTKFEENSAQQALRVIEEKALIHEILSESLNDNQDDIKVLVGGDDRYEGMSELSLVVGRYGTSNVGGAISVLGPIRMRYGRAISTVRYVSTLMSAMMQDVYGDEQ